MRKHSQLTVTLNEDKMLELSDRDFKAAIEMYNDHYQILLENY